MLETDLTDNKPLFTFTAEDFDTIKLMAFLSLDNLDLRSQMYINTKEECQKDADRISELFTRIKQWQDDNIN